mmetsp:Transcript_22752/g.35383  ORF Transcript_22752/g.35383 Transcript_22752/m.35383 type:complete len:95 (-) Transcript_22752:88-372(-)
MKFGVDEKIKRKKKKEGVMNIQQVALHFVQFFEEAGRKKNCSKKTKKSVVQVKAKEKKKKSRTKKKKTLNPKKEFSFYSRVMEKVWGCLFALPP